MRGPEAGQVAVEEITLDGLAEARGAAARVDLPAGEEDQRTAQGDVRIGRSGLQRDHIMLSVRVDGHVHAGGGLRVVTPRGDAISLRVGLDAVGLPVDGLQVLQARLPVNVRNFRKRS